jgi:hypothetical protein
MEILRSMIEFIAITATSLVIVYFMIRPSDARREEEERVQKECAKLCYPYAVLSCEEELAICADESAKWKKGKKP